MISARVVFSVWALMVLTGCNGIQTALKNRAYDRDTETGRSAPPTDAGISWRIVGNFSPLGINKIPEDWPGGINLIADSELARTANEQIAFKKVAMQSRRLRDTSLTVARLPAESGHRHYHYREVINQYGYGAAGHTHLTPLFDMELADQLAGYVPPVPYVPSTEYSVVASLPGVAGQCQWSLNGNRYQHSCQNVTFAVAAGGHSLAVTAPNGDTHRAEIKPTEITLLALGDGHIGGEGLSHQHWQDIQCHRSTYSWPFLLAARLAGADQQSQFNVLSRACSGAASDNLLADSYAGVERPELPIGARGLLVAATDKPPQIAAAVKDLCGYLKTGCQQRAVAPDYILLSVGDSDIGFSDTLVSALESHRDQPPTNSDYSAQVTTAIAQLEQSYRRLAQRLAQDFPGSRVIMTGYLDPLRQRGERYCRDAAPLPSRQQGRFAPLASLFAGSDAGTRALGEQYVRPILEGIAAIGRALERDYPGFWYFAPVTGYDETGNQSPGYKVNGFCTVGSGVDGSWFNVASSGASEQPAEGLYPNIFGQLYYVERVHARICEIDQRFACNR